MWLFFLIRDVVICVFLKVAAVAPIRRHMLWEAGPGPGGSYPTSKGKSCLLWPQAEGKAEDRSLFRVPF